MTGRGSRSRRWNRRGFTIVELMIVVALIGILSALAIFTLARSSDERELRRSVVAMNDILTRARMTAINRGQPVEVQIRPVLGTPNNVIVQRFGTPATTCQGGSPTILDMRTIAGVQGEFLNAGIANAAPQRGNQLRICFLPSGRVVEAGPGGGRPFTTAGSDGAGIGGLAYIEMATVIQAADPRYSTTRSITLAVNLAGQIERMPAGFTIEEMLAEVD